jgi:hypothetical protein
MSKEVGAGATKRMPVDDRKMQVVAHRFAFDDFGRLVMFEGQRVPGFRPFEFDL